jgi:hypothetical protein
MKCAACRKDRQKVSYKNNCCLMSEPVVKISSAPLSIVYGLVVDATVASNLNILAQQT